jgi:GTP 3',8-cyclase
MRFPTEPLPADSVGRPLRDLRISVTDRCNFRCTYCMPKEVFGRDFHFLPSAALLTFEEIERLARIFVGHGVEKIRLTGGEPLVRRGLEQLVAKIARIEGLHDLTMTTNGSLLAPRAKALRDAGLRRITISLDSLDENVFRAMNDVDYSVSGVLAGIDAAAAAGFESIKINCVVKRGINDRTIVDLAGRFRGTGMIVRFIEYMDVGSTNGWRLDDVVPAAEVVALLDAHFGIEPIGPNYRGEVAQRYRYRNGGGEIGMIASVTQPFCRDCTRARLSSEGLLYTCLFGTVGHDFRALLRGGKSDDDISSFLRGVWRVRGDRYSELRTADTAKLPKVEMSHIGG